MDSLFDVCGVCIGEGEEGFVASAGEFKHGFLAVDFHFAWVFEGLVEGATEGAGCCCSRDDEMACVMGTREHFMSRRGSAFGHGWWLEEVGILAICPEIISEVLT